MDFKTKAKEYLVKLQNFPDQQKKIILWTIVVILGLIMAFFWFKVAVGRLSKISSEAQSIQNIKIEFPQVEAPDIIPATGSQMIK